MFDKKTLVKEYVESKTLRYYMEGVGLNFSDSELATIIFNSGRPVQTIHHALEEVAEGTEDQLLKEQIRQRIAYDLRCLELFEANDGSCFYQLNANADTDEWTRGEVIGHFAAVKLALDFMANKNVPFTISKYQIIGLRESIIGPKCHWNPVMFPYKSVEEYPYDGSAIGSCSYDAEKNLLRYWTEEIGEKERIQVDGGGAARFEQRYISVPNPFERGDIVRCTDELDEIGVVETSQMDWQEWEKRVDNSDVMLEYYDANIIVDFPTEKGTFYHSHVSPIYLEKIDPTVLEGDERKELLEVAGQILTGQASLGWFTHVCEDYGKKMSHEKGK